MESKLATLFVEISQRGLQATVASLNVVHAALSLPAKTLGGLNQALVGISDGFSKLIRPVVIVSGLLGMVMGFLIRGASAGTQEAFHLAEAWELLARVIGDMFAPYVRALTGGLVQLAQWFHRLNQTTKDSIAFWSIAAAGAAAFVAILPTVMSALGAVVQALAVLFSPTALGIGVALAAFGYLFTKLGEWADANADTMNNSNRSWIQNLINGIGVATVAISKMLNWLAEQGAKVSEGWAKILAILGEGMGLLPKGTYEQLSKMKEIGPLFKIDTEGLKTAFGAAERFGKVFSDSFNPKQWITQIQNSLKGFGGGFHIKADVQFESLQGTWERLQKAFAGRSGVEQAQLGELQQIREGIQKLAADGVLIKGLMPVLP